VGVVEASVTDACCEEPVFWPVVVVYCQVHDVVSFTLTPDPLRLADTPIEDESLPPFTVELVRLVDCESLMVNACVVPNESWLLLSRGRV